MNALIKPPLSTFKELDPNTFVNDPIALDVIFVHGLQSRATANVRNQLKRWLRQTRKKLGCRVWRFGFDGKELLTERRQRFIILASNLREAVQRMPGNSPPLPKQEPGISNQERKLVFIGHGPAGWVIQAALAWYSDSSIRTARRTEMVILLSLPQIQTKAALDMYWEKCLMLYPETMKAKRGSSEKLNSTITIPSITPGDTKMPSASDFKTIEVFQDNFKRLVGSPFGPQEKHITISNNDTPNAPFPRRETNQTSGSNNTDSSNASGMVLTKEQALSWNITAGDATDTEITSLLRNPSKVEKSDSVLPKPHYQPDSQPLAPKQAKANADEFRRILGVLPGLTSESSKSDSNVGPPPTQPKEIGDPSAEAVLSKDLHFDDIPRSLETTSPSSSLISSNAASMDDSEANQETTDTATDYATDREVETETDEKSVRSKDPPEGEGASKSRTKSNPSPDTRQLLELASSYQQSGELQKSKALYERVIEILAPYPMLQDGVNFLRLRIAISWLYEGQVKAAQKVFKELEAKVEIPYAKQPQWTWEAKHWLAVSLDMQGFYKMGHEKLMAITTLQQTLGISLLSKSTLALVFGHLGRYAEALSRSEEVLELAGKAVDMANQKAQAMNGEKGHPVFVIKQQGTLGSIQFDRATILTIVGQYKEAEEMNSQALENIRRNWGNNHVLTLDCYSLKARHFASTCRLPEAEEQCEKTLKVMRKEIGKEHPSTLRTLGILLYVYRLQARLTEALDTAKYLVERCKNSDELGETHPETISSRWQLAEVYLARGNFTKALRLQEKVVKMAADVLGRVRPTVLKYRSCLARFYCNMGRWTLVATLSLDALIDYRSIISKEFQEGADVTKYQDGSKPEELEDLTPGPSSIFERALDKARNIFISDKDAFILLNFLLMSTMQCLAVTERERPHGNLEVAQEIQTKAYGYMARNLRADHEDTLSLKLDLALTKLKMGQDDALRDLEDVTASRRVVLGEDRPDTLAARHHLSVAKFNISPNRRELAEQTEVLHLCTHLLGEEHPITNSARIDLSKGYHSVGRLQDAEQLRLKALDVQVRTFPQPELLGSAKRSYEQALKELAVQRSPHDRGKETNSELTRKGKNRQLDSPQVLCDAQVISSLAALALIYVDIGQSLLQLHNAEHGPHKKEFHQKTEFDQTIESQAFNKAIAAQRAVKDQHEILFGHSGPETLDSANTLGLIYQAAGDTLNAMEQYDYVQGHAMESSLLHFKSQSNQGTLLFSEGRFEEAEVIQTRAYAKKATYGTNVIGLNRFAICVFNLALTKKKLRKDEEALKLMEDALILSGKAYGHGGLIAGRILETRKEWSEAIKKPGITAC